MHPIMSATAHCSHRLAYQRHEVRSTFFIAKAEFS